MMEPEVEQWWLQTQAVYSKLLESGFPIFSAHANNKLPSSVHKESALIDLGYF